MEARDSGTLEAKRGMRTLSAKTGVDELVVDRDSATLTIAYRNGTSKTLPAAVQESEDFVPAEGTVRGTAWNPVSGKYENTRVPWNVSDENPYGPAIILVDGTQSRHIHGTNGPMDGGLPYIGGDDPPDRQITHGCARITNDEIVLLVPQIAATLRAGYTIGVIFQ
jgi:hypothetical protein